MSLLLPKLGVNRHMPRDVVYGPKALGGREIMDLTLEQPTSNLRTTLGHLRRNSKATKLLYATMRDVQIETGTSQPFYQKDPEEYHFVTKNTRWRYTWQLTNEFNVDLEIAQFWTPTPNHENDKNIMEYAVKDKLFKGKNKYKLCSINRCRLYQECFYISDLTQQDKSTVL